MDAKQVLDILNNIDDIEASGAPDEAFTQSQELILFLDQDHPSPWLPRYRALVQHYNLSFKLGRDDAGLYALEKLVTEVDLFHPQDHLDRYLELEPAHWKHELAKEYDWRHQFAKARQYYLDAVKTASQMEGDSSPNTGRFGFSFLEFLVAHDQWEEAREILEIILHEESGVTLPENKAVIYALAASIEAHFKNWIKVDSYLSDLQKNLLELQSNKSSNLHLIKNLADIQIAFCEFHKGNTAKDLILGAISQLKKELPQKSLRLRHALKIQNDILNAPPTFNRE